MQLIDALGWVRAVLYIQAGAYYCVGPFGTPAPITETIGLNRRTLQRAMQRRLKEMGYK